MSRRRVDRLEGSLHPKEAVRRWLTEAHAFGTLPAYLDSLIDQPETAQPFIALPAQVEQAVWESMRGQRSGFIKEVTREAFGDTVFLLRLVIGLNVHIEEVLRVERLRQASLYWWARALDAAEAKEDGRASGGRSGWERGLATHRGILLGAERARGAAEARYLDGHLSLFPELATEWRDLCVATEGFAAREAHTDDEAVREAERSVQRVLLMARADGLEAAGQHRAADALADRVGRYSSLAETSDR